MALEGDEVLEGGFVRDGELGPLVTTTEIDGAIPQSGFLRDPDGRLVVTTDDTDAMTSAGFLRAPSGALVAS